MEFGPYKNHAEKKFPIPTFFVFSPRFRTPRTRLSKKKFCVRLSFCLSVFLSFCDSVFLSFCFSVNTITQQRINVESSLRCQNVGI